MPLRQILCGRSANAGCDMKMRIAKARTRSATPCAYRRGMYARGCSKFCADAPRTRTDAPRGRADAPKMLTAARNFVPTHEICCRCLGQPYCRASQSFADSKTATDASRRQTGEKFFSRRGDAIKPSPLAVPSSHRARAPLPQECRLPVGNGNRCRAQARRRVAQANRRSGTRTDGRLFARLPRADRRASGNFHRCLAQAKFVLGNATLASRIATSARRKATFALRKQNLPAAHRYSHEASRSRPDADRIPLTHGNPSLAQAQRKLETLLVVVGKPHDAQEVLNRMSGC